MSIRSALLLCAALAACGVDTMSDEPPVESSTAQDIVGGETTTQWEAIGYMYGPHERCSGVMIAPNAFLTAAHCTVQGLPMWVGFGKYRKGGQYAVGRYYVSPGYVPGNEPNHDVAVLILNSPVDVAPLALAGTEYPGVTPAGRELRVTGYGDDKSGLYAPDPVVTAPRKTAHIHVDFANSDILGSSGINGQACFGDSGGPVTDLDVTKVYAVQSWLYFPCQADQRSRAAAVAYEPFIQQALYNNPPAPYETTTPFWRYFNPVNLDHYYDSNRNDAGFGYYGYGFETSEGRITPYEWPGLVPLYRYWHPSGGDHFYTTNFGELGWGAGGWSYDAIAGYVFPVPYAGTVPLNRYWSPFAFDHYYTINRNDAGMAYYGYGFEKVEGYVYP